MMLLSEGQGQLCPMLGLEKELVRLDYNPGTACSYTAESGVNISSIARNNILAEI